MIGSSSSCQAQSSSSSSSSSPSSSPVMQSQGSEARQSIPHWVVRINENSPILMPCPYCKINVTTKDTSETRNTEAPPPPASSDQPASSSYTAPATPPNQQPQPAHNDQAPPPKYSPTDPIYRHDNLQSYYVVREGSPLERRPQPYQVIVVPDRSSTQVYCPYCNTTVTTRVSRRPGLAAGCWAAICCFVCWPCFWIPLVVDPCLDEVHYCSRCSRAVAVYES
ncbi:MAG: LITAF-like zinc ribbon domain-containing protein [Piptocephalis tieghemiana]|nr:MAG: LITAF-like zinc ribbon domain-containing protein [Piptocephalis tieghemiana]